MTPAPRYPSGVELLLTDGEGNTYRKSVQVILPVTPEKRAGLMDAIASGYADTKDEWTAMDMAVYSTLDGKTAALTDTAKQNVLNLLIKDANNQKDNLSDHSQIEIVLRSLGIDSTRLYSVNSSTPTDNAKILSAADYSTLSYYTAPYILLANLQGNVKLSAAQVNTLIGILKANMGSGLFESVYKGITYTQSGHRGRCLGRSCKVLRHQRGCESSGGYHPRRAFLRHGCKRLLRQCKLRRHGHDRPIGSGQKTPAALTSVSGASVVDGMLSYVNTGTNQFRYSGEDNALATEQAFRALAALAHFKRRAVQCI